MALEVNMSRAYPDENAFKMTPRRIFYFWLSVKTLEAEKEKRLSIAVRWAEADEKSFDKYMRG